MGLISPGGENLLDFLELWQVLSTYDGDLRDPLSWVNPHASCSGASRDSSLFEPGAKDLVWSRCRNLSIPLQC